MCSIVWIHYPGHSSVFIHIIPRRAHNLELCIIGPEVRLLSKKSRLGCMLHALHSGFTVSIYRNQNSVTVVV